MTTACMFRNRYWAGLVPPCRVAHSGAVRRGGGHACRVQSTRVGGALRNCGGNMDIMSLLIQLVTGAIGGNIAGGLLKQFNLGPIGNTIAGLVGGVGGGQLLGMLAPGVAAAAGGGGMDIGSIIGQI